MDTSRGCTHRAAGRQIDDCSTWLDKLLDRLAEGIRTRSFLRADVALSETRLTTALGEVVLLPPVDVLGLKLTTIVDTWVLNWTRVPLAGSGS